MTSLWTLPLSEPLTTIRTPPPASAPRPAGRYGLAVTVVPAAPGNAAPTLPAVAPVDLGEAEGEPAGVELLLRLERAVRAGELTVAEALLAAYHRGQDGRR